MSSKILIKIATHNYTTRYFNDKKPHSIPKGFTTHVSIHRDPGKLSELGIAINQDIILIIIAK
jgi:hypothetical protein